MKHWRVRGLGVRCQLEALCEKPWASDAKVFGPPCLVQGRNDGWPVLGRRKGLFAARLRGWRKEGFGVFVHGQRRRRGAVHIAGRRGARIGRGERVGERVGREARPLRAVVVVRVKIQLVTRSLVERAINVHHVGGFCGDKERVGGIDKTGFEASGSPECGSSAEERRSWSRSKFGERVSIPVVLRSAKTRATARSMSARAMTGQRIYNRSGVPKNCKRLATWTK